MLPIARRRQAGIDGDDLLSRLLAARDADTGEAMDTQQIRDEALVFCWPAMRRRRLP